MINQSPDNHEEAVAKLLYNQTAEELYEDLDLILHDYLNYLLESNGYSLPLKRDAIAIRGIKTIKDFLKDLRTIEARQVLLKLNTSIIKS